MAENGTIAYITEPKKCDFPHLIRDMQNGMNQAEYDFKTNAGPWANGCERHWKAHRLYPDLGLGKGQRLVLKTEEPAHVAGEVPPNEHDSSDLV